MEKPKKNKTVKIICIIVGTIIAIFVGIIAYMVVNDFKQEDQLKKEIVNLSNKNLSKDDFSIKIRTRGDYAYIEESIKKYYLQLSDSVKKYNEVVLDNEFANVLSITNLENDGPNFKSSLALIDKGRKQANEALNVITNLCKEETILSLIDKEKVDDYSYDLYKQLMYTEEDLAKLNEEKMKLQTLAEQFNTYLDKSVELLTFLTIHSDDWYIEDQQLYIIGDSLLAEYNQMVEELNQLDQNLDNL